MSQEHFPLLRQFSLAPQPHLSYQPLNVPSKTKPAAVLLPIIPDPQGDRIVLIQRALHLKHHPGQMAFPGGRWEETDTDLIHTALRETQEEIGLSIERSAIFGQLPSLTTVSGYRVTPYLAKLPHAAPLNIDKNEVHQAFNVPLNALLNPKNHHQTEIWRDGKKQCLYSIPYQGHTIWGATAQMLITLSTQIWPLCSP